MPAKKPMKLDSDVKRPFGFQYMPDWEEIKVYYIIWKMRRTQADPRPLARPKPISYKQISEDLFVMGFRNSVGNSFLMDDVYRMAQRTKMMPVLKKCVKAMEEYVAQHPEVKLIDLDVEPMYKMYNSREMMVK